jgi:transposase
MYAGGMEAYSLSVRKRIIELYQSGLDTADVAQIMAVSESGVRRVWQRYRADKRIAPLPHGGGQRPALDAERKKALLVELVGKRPDAFVGELRDALEAQPGGVKVCRQTLGRWLEELGLTRKKSRSMPPSSRGKMSRGGVPAGSGN